MAVCEFLLGGLDVDLLTCCFGFWSIVVYGLVRCVWGWHKTEIWWFWVISLFLRMVVYFAWCVFGVWVGFWVLALMSFECGCWILRFGEFGYFIDCCVFDNFCCILLRWGCFGYFGGFVIISLFCDRFWVFSCIPEVFGYFAVFYVVRPLPLCFMCFS